MAFVEISAFGRGFKAGITGKKRKKKKGRTITIEGEEYIIRKKKK